MKRRILTLLVLTSVVFAVASLLGVGKVGVSNAYACDTSYWNISCRNYDPHTGAKATVFMPSIWDTVYSTFNNYDTVRVILTTSGGSWLDSADIDYGWAYTFVQTSSTNKVGCQNNHDGTQYINCRHYDGS